MMAEGMADGKFWLPADFLADDLFLEGEGKGNGGNGRGFGWNLSYPVDSMAETKNDEDDYIAGLTRRMAHSFLHNDGEDNPKVGGRGLFPPPWKTGLCSAPVLTQQQLQAAQFYQLKQEQVMKQQFSAAWRRQNRARGGGVSALPPLQKQQTQPGSAAMRAVFLNGSGARRESTGTGVFLPRRIGNPNEPHKKGAAMVRSNQKRNPLYLQPGGSTSHEIHLPHEWTY